MIKWLQQHKKTINFIIDILIILSFAWYIVCLQFNLFDCDHDGWSRGLKTFKYFTNVGNSLLFISSCINIYCLIKNKVSKFNRLFRYISVTSTTVIFLVTYFALTIYQGFGLCFKLPNYLFEHTILPILGLIQLFAFDEFVLIEKKKSIYGSAPVTIYASVWIIVLLILNLPGEVESNYEVVPYFFLAIHNQPVYLTIIYALIAIILSWLTCLLFISINNKIRKKNN